MRKLLMMLMFAILGLSACSGMESTVESKYPTQDVVYDENDNVSRVYRAYNKSVDKVVKEITKEKEPESRGEKDDHVVLAYDKDLIQVYPDPKKKEDSLIEVSSDEFVRDNYGSNFFLLYGMSNFGTSHYKVKDKGSYSGYVGSNGKYIKNSGSSSSVRFGSSSNTSSRGGGPGSGK